MKPRLSIMVTLSLQCSLGWGGGGDCVIYDLFDSGRVSCEALGMNELNKAFIHFSVKKKKKREHIKKDHEESVSLHTVDMMQNLTFCLSNSLRLFLPFPLKTHG